MGVSQGWHHVAPLVMPFMAPPGDATLWGVGRQVNLQFTIFLVESGSTLAFGAKKCRAPGLHNALDGFLAVASGTGLALAAINCKFMLEIPKLSIRLHIIFKG